MGQRRPAQWAPLLIILLLLVAGCGQIQPPPTGESPPWETPRPTPTPPPAGRVRLLASWRGGDEAGFLRALEVFTARTGIAVDYTGEAEVADALLAAVEAGVPPDVVVLPKPNWLWELASAGAIPPLPPDVAALVERDFSPAWVELVSYGGEPYGVPVRAASKSLLWYRPDALRSAPALDTLDDLEAAAEGLSARGVKPFVVPAGEGGGWPLTDWFENILLAEAGPAAYEALARHDIPWTHPDVRRAAVRFAGLLRDEWLLGGAEGAVELPLAESFEAAFTPPRPRAAFWLGLGPVVEGQRRKFPHLRPGEHIGVTSFPANGVVGVADVAVALNGREETRRLMAFLAGAEMPLLWVGAGGYFISPNRALSPSAYTDSFRAYEARQLQEAAAFAYDLSDRLPRLLAQELQRGLTALLLSPDDVDAVLAQIEEVAGREQGFR